jgi:hypothetical protein
MASTACSCATADRASCCRGARTAARSSAPSAAARLTRLEFAEDRGRTTQRLAVNVIIGNGVAAGITRTVLPLFGWFVDRKLTEGFRTTAAAAAWAHAKRPEFCAWLGAAFTADRRSQLLAVFDECALAVRPSPGASHTAGSAREAPDAGDFLNEV